VSDSDITSEAVWRAEYVPAALKAFGDRVKAKLGCVVYYKGNTAHLKGRHRSRNWCLTSDYCTNPGYGTTDARDKRGPGDALRATDVMIAGRTLQLVCKGIDEAVRAGRLPELAEWFGTLDGRTVAGWFQGRAGTSDTSHLTHLHLGVWTEFVELAAFYDRLFDAMMTYIDGDDMTPDEVTTAVVKGVHSALDQAATRSTPTGRQMGDDIATLLAPVRKPVEELAARPQVQPAPVDVAALAAALKPELSALVDAAAEAAVRRVLGAVDGASPATPVA
jgi:hypothetical protein